MQTKQIVFTKPCVAELFEINVAPPKPDEVQVKMAVSTISSGTERANLVGDPNVSALGPSEVVFPRYTGYSSAGVVLDIGENVTDIKVGDRVAMSWSAHSGVLNMPRGLVYKLDDSISFGDAALFHISTFPLAAIRKCRLEIGESAVIMGLGVLGLVAIPLLKAAGAVPVVAVDPVAEKREKALKMGADYAFDPFSPNFAKSVKAVTSGGAKVGIEVTGVGAGLDGILDCMAPFGRVALLGCTRNKDFTIDYYKKIHAVGITLVGAHTIARPEFESHAGWWTLKDDVAAVIRLTLHGRLKLSDVIDETYSPNIASEVYARLANQKSFPIVQFDWSDLD